MGKSGSQSKSRYIKKEKKVTPVKEHDRNERLFNELIKPRLGYVRSLVEYYSNWGSDVDYNYSVTMERFFRYINNYNHEKPIDTWIHICVKNTMTRLNKEFAKEKQRRTGIELDQAIRTANQPTTDIAIGQRPLSETLPDEIYNALLTIPEHKLSPFLLHVQGYSVREIAQMEYKKGNTPKLMVDAIKARIFWTRTKLKGLLNEYARRKKDK